LKYLYQKILASPCVLIALLFIIAKTWNQYMCPSADEWIRKYYSMIKE
jgi:hypothetical protein